MSAVDQDDKRLLELYAQFLKRREAVSIGQPAEYAEFAGPYDGASFAVGWLSEGEVPAVTNKVNAFWRHLGGLIAWNEIYQSLDEDDKFNVVIEFITPTADHCLSMPYSIKQMLIKSICHISHQTNRFCGPNFSEEALKKDRNLNFHEAEKLAGAYAAWSRLRDALLELDDGQYRKESNDYRNELNHGFATNIEYGHFLTIKRVDGNPSAYNFMSVPPLQLGNVISSLARQYNAALLCHDRYIDLIREQHAHWPKGVQPAPFLEVRR